jgi:hypothetical protein
METYGIVVVCKTPTCGENLRLEESTTGESIEAVLAQVRGFPSQRARCPKCGQTWNYSGSEFGCYHLPKPPETRFP